MHRPVRSSDEKIYLCDTCHKHLFRNEMPRYAVSNKMSLNSTTNALQKMIKSLNFQDNVLKNRNLHGKGEFTKIKSSICTIQIEARTIRNILPKPEDSKGLMVVKLKQDLMWRGYIYFEAVLRMTYTKDHII